MGSDLVAVPRDSTWRRAARPGGSGRPGQPGMDGWVGASTPRYDHGCAHPPPAGAGGRPRAGGPARGCQRRLARQSAYPAARQTCPDFLACQARSTPATRHKHTSKSCYRTDTNFLLTAPSGHQVMINGHAPCPPFSFVRRCDPFRPEPRWSACSKMRTKRPGRSAVTGTAWRRRLRSRNVAERGSRAAPDPPICVVTYWRRGCALRARIGCSGVRWCSEGAVVVDGETGVARALADPVGQRNVILHDRHPHLHSMRRAG